MNIGSLCQVDKAPQVIKDTGQKIHGYVFDSGSASRLQYGSLLVAERDSIKIFCTVHQILAFEKSVHIVRNSAEEFCVQVVLEPTREVTADYDGVVRPQPLNEFSLRFPTEEEVHSMTKLPVSGVALGSVAVAAGRDLTYRFPERQAYQSVFLAGVQGVGKTNFMKCLAGMFAAGFERKPAIIIVDVEGEYSGLANVFAGHAARSWFSTNGVAQLPAVDVKAISYRGSGDFTLPVEDILPEDLPMFVPQLGGVSADLMMRLAGAAYHHLSADPGTLTMRDVARQIQMFVNSQLSIHQSVRNAVLRACESSTFRLFDEEGKNRLRIEELLQPGKITVLDLSGLEHDYHQRTAALWVLLALHRIKLYEKNDVPVLLFVDEAHRLFPRQTYGDVKAEYIKRLAGRVSEITHRGRKREYGIVFATQSPADIAQDIVNLCNTKAIMHLSGYGVWVKQQLGQRYVKEIESLRVGEAIIVSKGLHEPQRIRIPNVSGNSVKPKNLSPVAGTQSPVVVGVSCNEA